MSKLVTRPNARLALISLTAAAAVASVHHIYRLGPEVLIPAVIIAVLPYLLLRHYRSSGSRLAL
jgi:Flp pilus assembly protein TadB